MLRMAWASLWFTSLHSLFEPTCIQVKLRQPLLKHTKSQINYVKFMFQGINLYSSVTAFNLGAESMYHTIPVISTAAFCLGL